ncbi:hypothetical protein [Elizabethkingia anophelis]|uniref:AbiTii domain-containing protein n=1 Tax=Elizabethkingia anophelis TaxID=1117645 RepID=UPI001D2CA26A|nr:hypothetical protein [Elizabethkingia anophelis]EHM7983043.1 hypothetical protein [Elizabethkingia anophelis]EHM8030265.1 hypothetical protein [Elizabethkingia anophelis]EHZ9533019.1 hypothetical protein [Elizabethkingia anophelis]EKU3670929.1 hypothetical protein [Elizabethkingia anophelis]EKW9476298.1 hypothetical protein [Elizabethkingia anophelis]
MNTNFPLQEIIEDLINVEKSLSSALIRLHYFGKLINNEELIKYTDEELNGYNQESEVPDYRQTLGTLRIQLQTYKNQHSVILPISMLEEPYRQKFKYIAVREGISAVEKIAKEINEKDETGEISMNFPMEILFILQEPTRKLYKSDVRIDVIGAKMCGSSNVIIEIPNAVRTRLLDFVMKIADAFGYNIEIETFKSELDNNNKTINNYMNTTINNNGDGNLINNGSNNTIESQVTINKGDLTKLKEELSTLGIEDSDIEEISAIIVEENPNIEENKLGTNANRWISNVINKSLNGIGKISTAVSANLLATMLKGYIGM